MTVIPDGALGYLPFDALLKQQPQEARNFKDFDYLLRYHSISYCYSATLLQEMIDLRYEDTEKKLGAFAPLFPPGNGCDLSTLEFNQTEAQRIGELIEGDLYLAEAANEQTFVEAASNYEILHLATHGEANDEAGAYSYLAFTCLEDSVENELLYAKELYNLRLKAKMVVLSACQTGIGELQKGEGIISLARGFSYAGAKSVVTTLWSINDKNAEQLMTLFYRELTKGVDKDIALQQAKLATSWAELIGEYNVEKQCAPKNQA